MKISAIVLSIPLLISCNTINPIKDVQRIFYKPNIPIVNAPDSLNIRSDVKWDVVVKDNIDEYLGEITQGGQYVFYAISVRDYEKMSLNLAELKRYIEQQKEIITYYEKSVKK